MRADRRSLVVAWTLVTAVLMLGIFSVSCGAAEPTPAPTAEQHPRRRHRLPPRLPRE